MSKALVKVGEGSPARDLRVKDPSTYNAAKDLEEILKNENSYLIQPGMFKVDKNEVLHPLYVRYNDILTKEFLLLQNL